MQSNMPTLDTGSVEPDESEDDNEPMSIKDGEECDCPVDINKAKNILLQAILWLKVHSHLESNTTTATVGIKTLPFLQLNVDNIFMVLGSPSNPDDLAQHQKRLDDTLAAWNFKRVPVDGDGDCIFQSIASGLLQLARCDDPHVLTILKEHSVSCTEMEQSGSCTKIEQLVSHLRQAVVSEWMGPNASEYQSFLTSTQLLVEAPRFLQRGVHCGDLGDLVIAAMSNALKMPIIVFTSAPNFPFTTIMPTYNLAATSQPIYVAMTQCDDGHYDAVVPAHTPSDSDEGMNDDGNEENEALSDGTIFCTCGRKKSAQSKACTLTEHAYKTRCPCHKSSLPCTHRCRCKNCHNELGKTPKPETIPTAKRKRAQHLNQEHDLKGRKGQEFMIKVGEVPRAGPWTTFEFLTAVVILRELEDGSVDTQDIISIRDAIETVAEALCLKVALPQRSNEEMQKLLRYCRHKHTEVRKVLQ